MVGSFRLGSFYLLGYPCLRIGLRLGIIINRENNVLQCLHIVFEIVSQIGNRVASVYASILIFFVMFIVFPDDDPKGVSFQSKGGRVIQTANMKPRFVNVITEDLEMLPDKANAESMNGGDMPIIQIGELQFQTVFFLTVSGIYSFVYFLAQAIADACSHFCGRVFHESDHEDILHADFIFQHSIQTAFHQNTRLTAAGSGGDDHVSFRFDRFFLTCVEFHVRK